MVFRARIIFALDGTPLLDTPENRELIRRETEEHLRMLRSLFGDKKKGDDGVHR